MKNKILFLLIGMFLLIESLGLTSAILWNNSNVAYWKVDELSGTLYASKGSINLTAGGSPVYNQTGIINGAISFDSSNDLFSGTDDGSLDFGQTADFTYNFWIKENTGGSGDAFFFNGGTYPYLDNPACSINHNNNRLYCAWGGGQVFAENIEVDNLSAGWNMITVMRNNTGQDYWSYMNGNLKRRLTNGLHTVNIDTFHFGDERGGIYTKDGLDEIGIWNRTLSKEEISTLYNGNSGNPCPYNNECGIYISTISINLTSPLNNSISSTSIINFAVNLSIIGTNYSYQWTNNTYNIWFNNGTLFNTTFVNSLSGNSTLVNINISNFILGNYKWNSYACYGNTTYSNCSWGESNNTFTMGSSINSVTYSASTYETSLEQFIINFSLAEGAQVSLVKLNYNGTNYTISNITISGNNYIFEKKINIPLNINGSANQTNNFYVIFTYNGGSIQNSAIYTQNSSFIKLIQCGGNYTTQALNFTFYDEYNLKNIDTATNKTNIFSFFKYWIGDGSIYKNYSYQNLVSNLNNYQFCISPYNQNINFTASLDMGFYADTYREGTYYLKNSILNNISNNILLYLIPQDFATKFFLTFQNGNNLISNGIVNVQEYFTGLGTYNTVAILQTDMDGKATMWQEVDKSYKYYITQDNSLLGIVDRVSICSSTPCTLNIQITRPIGSAFEAYDNYYAKNILSNISYNKVTSTVDYTFIDTTGLANYFRFEVKQTNLNGTETTICNLFSYSSAGTLSCNITGYTGDILATGYISRSPEKFDKFLKFVIGIDLIENLGTTGVFLVMILIITLVIGATVLSRGNPTTVLFVLGIALLGTKLIGLLFFSWTIVIVLEVLIFWMIFQIKS